ncbi:MAG: caspase family protein [Chitinivibrionales bacterium]|nr:caspase family protein [Chitinivibrionales bacterium]
MGKKQRVCFIFLGIVLLFGVSRAYDHFAADHPDTELAVKNQERLALIFGNDTAAATYSVLKYVRNDIKEFKDILVQNCGFKKENIITRHNPPAAEIRAILDSLRVRYHGPDKTRFFLLYYSGHADTSGLLMGYDRLPFQELKTLLDSLPFQMSVYILDACHSGTFSISAVKGQNPDTVFLPPRIPEQMQYFPNSIKGKALIYSSRSNQVSMESEKYNHSVFTYHLLSGLRGAAGAYLDNQTYYKISLQGLYNYVFDNIRREPNTPVLQVPGIDLAIKGEGDIVLAIIDSLHSGVAFDEKLSGDLFIYNRVGKFIAKIFKKDKNKMLYALKQGMYKCVYKGKYTILDVRPKGALSTLTEHDFTNDDKNSLHYGFVSAFETVQPAPIALTLYTTSGVLSAECIWKNAYRFAADAGYLNFQTSEKNNFPNSTETYEMITSVPTTFVRIGAGIRNHNKPLQCLWLNSGLELRYEKYRLCLESGNGVSQKLESRRTVFILPYAGIDVRRRISPFFDCGLTLKAYAYHIFQTVNISGIKNNKSKQIVKPRSKNYDFGFFMSYMINRY